MQQTSSPPDLPMLFCLHFLGGSARSWDDVESRLAGSARCVALDLPGFGKASDVIGYSVAEMSDYVVHAIRLASPTRWFLAGHSMGAKVAAAVARRAEDGEAGLEGLAGLILIAGSPPGPEPMEDDKRRTMLSWFVGTADQSRAEAETYIQSCVETALDNDRHSILVDAVLSANPAAWMAWLDDGSCEDWSSRVGRLQTPALIVAGAADAELGTKAQEALKQSHFHSARLVTLPGGHLLPVETPGELAALIAEHIAATALSSGTGGPYRDLIMSDRVSRQTRALLLQRGSADSSNYVPQILDATELTVLRSVLARVLPQRHRPEIDLAARIDAQLAKGAGDGWRFASLPCDREAYRAGLRTLNAADVMGFCSLAAEGQDAVLQCAATGQLTIPGDGLMDPGQMKLWFEDVRADAVRIYVAHPATLSWMGYSGIGYGGDGEPKAGFRQVGVGEREGWEPLAMPS